MGKKEPLRFSKLLNALVIQGEVTNSEYNNFVNNEKNKAKIKKVKTIYIEKGAEICCSFSDFSNVTKVVLRGDPQHSHPSDGWLPKKDGRMLDVSALKTDVQVNGEQDERWGKWACDTKHFSRAAEKRIEKESGSWFDKENSVTEFINGM